MPASSSSSGPLRGAIIVTALAASVGLSGCTEYEVDRPGTWKASGANDQNLRAMLVDPRDYSLGTGSITARGDSGSRAVTRLNNERRRQLIDAAVSRIGPSNSAADNSSAGPAPGGSTGSGGGASGGGTQ